MRFVFSMLAITFKPLSGVSLLSRKNFLAWLTLSLLFVVQPAWSEAETVETGVSRQYTFAWQFLPEGSMAPRGGTTTGPGVNLATSAGDAWRALTEPGLSDKERDRRAILAMAGAYRTSFDFIETVGFTSGYEPRAPYQSWGTEHVYVVADEDNFISLQHILVMLMNLPDGTVSEPIVVKHWRHDWTFEERDLYVYEGHQTWGARKLTRAQARGRWTQSVYQVDDSPRYQAVGTWTHYPNYSSWHSEETWRPLPRREFSVRDDYHVLVGTNKHTINPTGWVQEEENLKVVLDAQGQEVAVLAKEVGLARYERIVDFDWSAGDAYWARTGAYWQAVRETWRDMFKRHQKVSIKPNVAGKTLFGEMFAQVRAIPEGAHEPYAYYQKINEVLGRFVTTD